MLFTVACVLQAKGQNRYNADWVGRLKNGVAKHCAVPHRFVCLSDVPVPCERIPLENRWHGWWSKLELFRPGLLEGQVLYLDLDTLVVGDVTKILALGGFWGVKDFNHPVLCSTAMSWAGRTNKQLNVLYEEFEKNPTYYMQKYRGFVKSSSIGDQGYIFDTLKKYNIGINYWPPGRVVSYRKQAKDKPPKDAVAVAFHGRPKMDVAGGWAQKEWESL